MNKNIYTGIDFFKLICALMIICMHTLNYNSNVYLQIFNKVICGMAVPFFFITSGFFLQKGLTNTDDKKSYFLSYLKRLGTLYLIWTVITLPVSIYVIKMSHPDANIIICFMLLIRNIFFVGSLGIYWYILALMLDSIVLYFCNKYNNKKTVFFISIILFLIGILYNSNIIGQNNFVYNAIHIIFSSERNFLNVGLFYVLIGSYLQQRENDLLCINRNLILFLFFIVVLIKYIETIYLNINCVQCLEAILLFLFAINIKLSPLKVLVLS